MWRGAWSVERGAWSLQAMQWVLLYRSATDGEVSLRFEQELHTHGCLGVHRGFRCGVERGAWSVERAGHAVGPPIHLPIQLQFTSDVGFFTLQRV
jgi:hypothetical protein